MSGLVHHWPLGESLKDVISGKNLILKSNGRICANRFGEENSAIHLEKGYGEFPVGIYFGPSGYTYMIWLKVFSISNHQRIIEFGNGINNNNIGIGIHRNGTSIVISLLQFKSRTFFSCVLSSSNFQLNEWKHLAVSVGELKSSLYVNGVEAVSCPNFPLNLERVQRSKNFIGGTAWEKHVYTNFHGRLDDLKIFNRELSSQEIVEEMDKTASKAYGKLLHIFTNLKLFTEGLVHY